VHKIRRRWIFSRLLLWLSFSVFLTAGCATRHIAPVEDIGNLEGSIQVPYHISSSGRILIDVSINEGPVRPLALDTGASLSVLYGDFAKSLSLDISDRTLFVRGLVSQGERPVIENVFMQMGPQLFEMEQMLMLETPTIKDEAVGLLGGDIMKQFVAVFDKDSLTATFVPRDNIDASAFSGWNKIDLQIFKDAQSTSRLYFATMDVDGREIPVLVDTGSNLNFINWKLATLDDEIKRIEKKLIKSGTLQGALDTTSVTTVTTFNDLELGRQNWDEVNVVVMGLNALDSVAPVDEPMMVAGAKVFAPHTVAFDLEGLSLYIQPEIKP